MAGDIDGDIKTDGALGGNQNPQVGAAPRPLAGAPLFEDRFETIPGTIDPPWWRRYRGAFEWSERRKLWIFHPERLVDLAAQAEVPPASGPAGAESASRSLQSFIGQKKVVSSLSIAIQAARLCGEAPPPILLCGPPGLGKTSLANRVALELGTRLHRTEGPALVDPGALVGMFSEMRKGDVLFIDDGDSPLPLP